MFEAPSGRLYRHHYMRIYCIGRRRALSAKRTGILPLLSSLRTIVFPHPSNDVPFICAWYVCVCVFVFDSHILYNSLEIFVISGFGKPSRRRADNMFRLPTSTVKTRKTAMVATGQKGCVCPSMHRRCAVYFLVFLLLLLLSFLSFLLHSP